MNQPLPADLVIFNELIFELNALVKSDVSEFVYIKTLKQIEARAEDLKRLSHAYGCSALGSVAAARGDIINMHKNHKISLQHGPDDLALLFNYAISLGKVGMYQDAYNLDLIVYERDQMNTAVLNHITLAAFELGLEREYVHYAKKCKKLTGKPHLTWPLYLRDRRESRSLTIACMAISAVAFQKDWDTPEEDAAWANL